ncbi:MAG: PIN domain-containing protein [Planctomycetota bacterium]
MIRHLDSDTIIAHLRGRGRIAERLKEFKGSLAMSAIVYCELVYGALKSKQPAEDLLDVQEFARIAPVVPLEPCCAEAYGRTRLDLTRRGLNIGDADLLIGATALAHNAILVTHNKKHFARIEGLQLEDWLA